MNINAHTHNREPTPHPSMSASTSAAQSADAGSAADPSINLNLDLTVGVGVGISRSHIRNPDPTTNSKPKPKPRRIARSIITPQTAAERAIFRRNAASSPLLRLPSEIRNRIWSLVLGERVLHVRREFKCRAVENAAGGGCGYWARRRRFVGRDVLRGRECACPYTEKVLFERYSRVLGELAGMEELPEMEEGEEEEESGADEASQAFNLDFSTLENPDVLENFDFDSFLNQSHGADFGRVFWEGLEEVGGETGTETRLDASMTSGGQVQDRDQAFNFDFSPTETRDVLEIFDFDAFLNQTEQNPYDTAPGLDVRAAGNEDGWFARDYFTLPDSLATLTPRRRNTLLQAALKSQPHSNCTANSHGTSTRRPLRQVSLHLLRSCRQVYGEANAVFWSSNTFSFSGAGDFSLFMQARSGLTRAMIQKVYLDVAHWYLGGWGEVFRRKELVSSLRGMKVLHVFIPTVAGSFLRDFEGEFLNAFRPFRGIGLRDVTVVVGEGGVGVGEGKGKGYKERIEVVKRLGVELVGGVEAV